MSTVTEGPGRDTGEAAEYLTQRGCKISPATLATYRSRKIGPAYYKSQNGQIVRYSDPDLDAFAAARLAPPMQRIEPQPETRSA